MSQEEMNLKTKKWRKKVLSSASSLNHKRHNDCAALQNEEHKCYITVYFEPEHPVGLQLMHNTIEQNSNTFI